MSKKGEHSHMGPKRIGPNVAIGRLLWAGPGVKFGISRVILCKKKCLCENLGTAHADSIYQI